MDDTVYDTATWKPLCKIPFEPNALGWATGDRLVAGSDRGRVQAFDSASGDQVGGVLQFYEGDAWLLVGADGHYRCTPGLEKHLVYVTRMADGKEERLSPTEFATKYGWKNDPAQARILPPPTAGLEKKSIPSNITNDKPPPVGVDKPAPAIPPNPPPPGTSPSAAGRYDWRSKELVAGTAAIRCTSAMMIVSPERLRHESLECPMFRRSFMTG